MIDRNDLSPEMNDDLTGYTDQSARIGELHKTINSSIEIASEFVNSKAIKLLIEILDLDAVDCIKQLVEIDVSDTRKVMELQAVAYRSQKFRDMLTGLSNRANVAMNTLKELEN